MTKRLTKRDFPRLTAQDWESIEAIAAMPRERRMQYKRLLRLLSNATRSGDEFTNKRFCKLAKPGVAIDTVLAELERRPPAAS